MKSNLLLIALTFIGTNAFAEPCGNTSDLLSCRTEYLVQAGDPNYSAPQLAEGPATTAKFELYRDESEVSDPSYCEMVANIEDKNSGVTFRATVSEDFKLYLYAVLNGKTQPQVTTSISNNQEISMHFDTSTKATVGGKTVNLIQATYSCQLLQKK